MFALALLLAACGGGSADSGGQTGSSAGTPVAVPADPVTPPAPATPDPAPAPTPGSGTNTPTLAGLDPVSSGIDVAKYLVPAAGTGFIPPSATADQIAAGEVGAFRFLCQPSHNAYDDPIVFPGQPGKAHLHTFFGNTKADGNSTYASLRTSGESTCNNLLNRSAYWVPAMMNGRGKVVMPNVISIYYKRWPSNSPYCTTVAKACVALPRGLRYIFGYNMADPSKSSPTDQYAWSCDGPGADTRAFRNIAQAAKGCPVGAQLFVKLNAPSCWNGTQLDSPDHFSHMAHMNYDTGALKCPSTHPYVVPEFTIAVFYPTDGTLDRTGNESPTVNTWYLSSDRMAGMAPSVPGSTIHTDWFGAWEDSVMSIWINNCIEKVQSCTGGDLGNGQQIRPDSGYSGSGQTVLVDPPVKP